MATRLELDVAISKMSTDEIKDLIIRLTEELILRSMQAAELQELRMEGDAP